MLNANDGADGKTTGKTYVWDVPTRVFHWALAIAVGVSLLTEELGEMDYHVISGHVVLGLVVFRIVWGFGGGKHARFADFVRGPGAVIAYARGLLSGTATEPKGHNPMGALSVLALLAVLAAQVGTGLFANDDIFTEGPLAKLVDKSTSDMLTYYHGLLSNALYALIGLHLAAIAFYTLKGHRLIAAMVHGHKVSEIDAEEEAGVRGHPIIALVAIAIAVAAAYYIFEF